MGTDRERRETAEDDWIRERELWTVAHFSLLAMLVEMSGTVLVTIWDDRCSVGFFVIVQLKEDNDGKGDDKVLTRTYL